jgi:hypothetical protein
MPKDGKGENRGDREHRGANRYSPAMLGS